MANEQAELVQKIQAELQKRYGDTSMASMRKLFDAYDRNGDQKISADELKQLLKELDIGNFATRGAWVDGITKALDSDGDKAIGWDEFSKAVS